MQEEGRGKEMDLLQREGGCEGFLFERRDLPNPRDQ